MAEQIFSVILMTLVKDVIANGMQGFIVGGHNAKINSYAHSAFLAIHCGTNSGPLTFGCGSSIVNQGILLTAAHCFEACINSTEVMAHVGNANKKKGIVSTAKSYKIHENYNIKTVSNDVALVRLGKDLVLGKTVQRVVLMKAPPYEEEAAVAGWGLTNEVTAKGSLILKDITKVEVLKRHNCLKLLRKLPVGSFCAGVPGGDKYTARGDSGSALVVRKLIQIGVVSFKNPSISKSVIVYTDVGHFYDWIRTNAHILYCKPSNRKQKQSETESDLADN